MHFGMNGNCLHMSRVICHTLEDFVLPLILLAHLPRIAGNGASEKNLKDGVCAQFEKNFAKAKWRV